jgi:YGGT family
VDEERVVTRRSEATPNDTPTDTPVKQTYSASTVTDESVRRTPSGGEVARRTVVFLFGLIQAVILLRILLLLANASQGNGIVRFIYDVSGAFVAPFEGILHVNAISAGVSVLDVSAVVAIIGWTVLEALVIAFIGIVRRES